MAAGDATAADVPAKYDCVINGKGYCFLDSLEESIPFRTHRAVYGQTAPFVERSNVSNAYGDNAQDFFLTVRQRDWSLGEQQKYFRAGTDGRYWMGSNVDVGTPGSVMLSPQVASHVNAFAIRAASRDTSAQTVLACNLTNLYRINLPGSGATDLGVHGLGAKPSRWGICTDGLKNYLATTTAGTVGIRQWSGAAFATFSATPADSVTFVNNTLYGYDSTNSRLIQYSAAGAATTLFTWKGADAVAAPNNGGFLLPWGGKLIIGIVYGQEAAEMWVYDGSGVSRLAVFPANFILSDMEVLYGVIYIAGSFIRPSGGSTVNRSAVLFWDGSELGKLWQSNSYSTTTQNDPALGTSDGRLVFTDETIGNVMVYDPARGGVSTIGSFTLAGSTPQIASTGQMFCMTRDQTTAYVFPYVYPSSGYVISSLIDFDSSLSKQFRGIKVEWDAATDGDGGSIDIAYQTDSLTGSWTNLRTAAVSGTEYTFTNISGHAIAIKVTINKGSSTYGPTLRSMSVRGAPVMPVYNRGELILDCTGTKDAPRELRDGTLHPLTGYEQMLNLTAARNSTTPITIVDKGNGITVGFIDVNDPEGFDIYEIHPAPDDRPSAGSYVVRLTYRGV